VPFSGKKYDAFPSVMRSLSVPLLPQPARCRLNSEISSERRRGLVLTRVVLLAHWLSDVAAGLAVGLSWSGC